MTERLPAPKKLPDEELTRAEIERGEKYPDYIIPLRARVKTPEQERVYEDLKNRAENLKGKLFEAYPNAWMFSKEKIDDIWQHIESELLQMASDARALADQHRGFNVGVVLVGLRNVRYPENPWVIIFDANTKPRVVIGGEQQDIRKHCGEQYELDRADPTTPETSSAEEKIDRAVILTVVGEPQLDDDSKRSQITLTPCKLCRDRLWKIAHREEKPFIAEDMPVVTADYRNLGLRKLQQVRDLHKFHGELPPGHVEID